MPELEGRAMDLFAEVLALNSEQRSARLLRACGGASELRARVEELLGHHLAAETIAFLERPLVPDPHSEPLPRPFGDYRLLKVVAVGGQGVVYEAHQVYSNKEVALKVVNPSDRLRSLRELEFAGNL